MEVNLNPNLGPIRESGPNQKPATQAQVEVDAAEFTRSQTLERTLAEAPDIRRQAVERARLLMGDVQYPPSETIHQLASLLALHMLEGQE